MVAIWSRGAVTALVGAALAACFNPSYDNPTCSPAGECPDGFTCLQGVCVRPGQVDAAVDAAATDALIDAPVDGATDGAIDARIDASIDAPIDAAIDAPIDAPLDAPVDAPIDGVLDVCGDGSQTGNEACDDGNLVTETECPYGIPSCVACNASCTQVLNLSGNVCGDGNVASGFETCDDGNMVTETQCQYGIPMCTRCSADCSTELNLTGPFCGDGDVTSGFETCDDANTDACGTCSADCSNAIAPAPATGRISTPGGSEILDGETFAIDDGFTAPIMFEFDRNSFTQPNTVPVPYQQGLGPGPMADAVAAAIGTTSLRITAVRSGPEVSLTHNVPSSLGNQLILENVASPFFVVTGMSGGATGDCPAGVGCGSLNDCASQLCNTSLNVCN